MKAKIFSALIPTEWVEDGLVGSGGGGIAGEKVNSFPSTEIGKVGDSQARLFYWSDKHIDFSTVNTSKQHSLPFMEKL